MNKEPRLRFTEEERSDPALEKPIRKAEKAAAKAVRTPLSEITSTGKIEQFLR